MPNQWTGSAVARTGDGSNSIIAFVNQINKDTINNAGYAGRATVNSNDELYCPWLISGLPNYSKQSSSATLKIQNISNQQTTVTTDFFAGIGSPNSSDISPSPTVLDPGERLQFNFRLDNALDGGVPPNWYGSAFVRTNNGAEIAATVNLFNKSAVTADSLGIYNCISPSP
jgi:hypothetical protein